jgi:hypothetical protein
LVEIVSRQATACLSKCMASLSQCYPSLVQTVTAVATTTEAAVIAVFRHQGVRNVNVLRGRSSMTLKPVLVRQCSLSLSPCS